MTDLPIREPGVFTDIDAETYHRDCVEGGSLSSSGARKLLPPGCPALFHYERHNPPEPKRHYDIGHAAHKLVLGNGPELIHIPFDTYRTKAAQTLRDDAHEDGHVPLLNAEWDTVHDMAAALREHPFAGKLFSHGTPEATLVWKDEQSGVMLRSRLDWLPDKRPGRMIIPDLKTAHSIDIDALSKAAASHGYAQQDAWYRAGCQALGLAGVDATFVFVFQAKEPPYLVHVVELDHVAHRIGSALNRQAISIYARCVETGQWPGYADDVTLIHLPAWYEKQFEG